MIKQSVRRVMARDPERWWTPQEIAHEVNCSLPYAYALLLRLYREGDVDKTEGFVHLEGGWGVAYRPTKALVREMAS